MSTIAWNCRGAGNSRTIQDLCNLVTLHKPKLVFLSETRLRAEKCRNLKWRLGLRNCIAVSSQGLSGGIALFWDESIKVEPLSQGERYIDVKIQESPDQPAWRATFVYGEPRVEKRKDMWELIRTLCGAYPEPWLVMGDFNEAMWQFEHFSETPRSEKQMMDFREVLSHCDLHDMGFVGLPWTYNNNQRGSRNVRVRLDRAVADSTWNYLFPDASIEHISTSRSDHKPLLLRLCGDEPSKIHSKIWRYEIMWERSDMLGMEIEKSWLKRNPGSDLGGVAEALKTVMLDLRKWSKEHFGNVNKKIEELRGQLKKLEESDPVSHLAQIQSARKKLDDLLYKEEMMWLQRSRITWLKEGDRNTKVFHRKAIWRAKKNSIKRLKKEDGEWCIKQDQIQEMTLQYFKKIFTKDDSIVPDGLVELFERKVTDDMNNSLCKEISDEEIGDALFQIGPLKAPGPDGFPARFFQRNWLLMKEEVIPAVRKFFDTGLMPDGVNETAIVLIPKVDHPETLKDYRPISLCNVLYKIVSKCIVNRLRPLLQELVADNQSAFIPGRMITDNALIAFECIHAINSNTDERGLFCAYKIDLSKAYDRVDWGFLEKVLSKLGFEDKWVNWVMACVTSVKYSVSINGVPTDYFSPSRGLRQGDPLSPYLFLFVADGLSNILRDRVTNKQLLELKICRRAPGISHLLFADDTLLFFKANGEQARQVKDVLSQYTQATGQLVNESKCSIMFSTRTTLEDQRAVKDILGVTTAGFEPKYLGLPTMTGISKRARFQPWPEKMKKRLSVYAEKHMSSAAKEVLIKAVAQALPTYVMSIFQLPLTTCDELTNAIRNFWWGSDDSKRKTAWLAWHKLILKKSQGGIGFRDMRKFNQALLARQAWRLLEFPDSLCAKILKARYYPQGCLIDTAFSSNGSPTWQAIQHGLELLKKGVIWRVGDGSQIRIWRDPWIPRGVSLRPSTKKGRCRLKWVSELFDQSGTDWDYNRICAVFNIPDAAEIAKIKIPSRHRPDQIAWHWESSGMFTVRSAYTLAMKLDEGTATIGASSDHPTGERSLWKHIWSGHVPPKVNIFCWKLCQDILPTKENKYKRRIEKTATCNLCGDAIESSYHAVISCPLARGLRDEMRKHAAIPNETWFQFTGPDWLLLLLDKCNPKQRDIVKLTLWQAWRAHNNLEHKSGPFDIQSSIHTILNIRELLDGGKEEDNMLTKGKQKMATEERTPKNDYAKDQWCPPPLDWLKINVDGSFDDQSERGGVGIVIRDHQGVVCLTAWRVLFRCTSALEAEIMACLEGIRLATQWFQQPMILETDCLQVMNALKSKNMDKSENGHLFMAIREMMSLLHKTEVNHIRRECNVVAHELAHLARRNIHTAVWLRQAPVCVSDILANECKISSG